MTTVVLLRIIDKASAPIDAGAIAPEFSELTGWSLTERGLTGAKRKLFLLTPLGAIYLERLEEQLAQIERA